MQDGRLPPIKYGTEDYERSEDAILKRADDDERTEFEIDRSRIIHSAAFRRLQGKTQVFATGEGDFFRTRLAHSLEVAQIGKGLALRLGAHPDLVEAVSLAHDIGHPPFGHAGEKILGILMKDHGGFEANAQNIRLLTKLEEKSMGYRGLNLTRATIDGQMKYKQPFSPTARKFYYLEDQPLVNWIAEYENKSFEEQSFDCQLMDWADEIAYSVHDLEDGIHSGFVTILKLKDPETEKYVTDKTFRKMVKIEKDKPPSKKDVCHSWEKLLAELSSLYPAFNTNGNKHTPLSDLKKHRKQMTSHFISKFIKAAVRAERPGAKSARYQHCLVVPPNIRTEQLLLNGIVRRLIMKSSQVLTLEQKANFILRELFELFQEKRNGETLLPEDRKIDYIKASTIEERLRVICDYLAGMTDLYAQRTYSRLFQPFAGSVFELV